jgi:hypothetical protein
MGQIRAFCKEKLVIPVLSSFPEGEARMEALLTDAFGAIDYTSPRLPFDFTDYYEPEMGKDLERFFLSFSGLIDPSALPEVKRKTNEIEEALSVSGKRRINLDPGILSLSRFILATTKDYSHRIPLSGGIYAEVTLVYRNGGFEALPWTYPDYASPGYRAILGEIRARYADELRLANRRGL